MVINQIACVFPVGCSILYFIFMSGLYKIHKLTQGRPHRLRVDLMEVNGERHYAEYSAFSVGGPDTKYRLQVSGYSGDAGTYRNIIIPGLEL